MHFIKKFKSPWYYWHTGQKKIALLSMLLSTGILWIGLGATVGFSMGGILLAILLDGVGFGLALLYLIFLRAYIPEWIGLQGHVDALVMNRLIWPLLVGFFVSRISSFVVADCNQPHAPEVVESSAAGFSGPSIRLRRSKSE
jgi:hypothetical protein